MTIRRVSFLALLLALMLAPLGRMGMAEAAAMPHHAPEMAMAGHCADMPSPAPEKSDKMAIDCAIACAGVAAMEVAVPLPITPARVAPRPLAPTTFAGIHPEADPPPPRFS